MVKMNIAIDNSALIQLQSTLARLGAGSMPTTVGAMGYAANYIAGQWRGFANGGDLPGVKPLSGPNRSYLAGIKVKKNGPFDYEIYNESKQAKYIEEGVPEFDMKTKYPYGQKSRVAKGGPNKGLPYLIIPFRWKTPKALGFRNIIPQPVYNMIKNRKRFEISHVKMTTHNEQNYSGQDVERREYDWGARLQDAENPNMEGMVRMEGQIEGGKMRTGGYFTFRIISAGSPANSWIRKAIPARPVVNTLKNTNEQVVTGYVQAGIKEDLGL
jgi:hypothetical protein